MSWKGFKKAVSRLPQQVLSKTGHAEETVDEEFESLEIQFNELELSTQRLHDDAKKYKDAVSAMLYHQHSFAETLLDLYSPITGWVPAVGGAELPEKTSRPATPPQSLKAVADYLNGMDQTRDTLTQDLSMIERRVIAPSADFLTVFKNIKKAITKRNHKKVDYDRWRNDVKKLQDAQGKDVKDERRLVQYQKNLEVATQEYNQLNDILKRELPIFLQLRVQFIDPCFASLYFLQFKMFTKMKDALEVFQRTDAIDLAGDPVLDYDRRMEGMKTLLDELKILNGGLQGLQTQSSNQMSTTGSNSFIPPAAGQNPPEYSTLPQTTATPPNYTYTTTTATSYGETKPSTSSSSYGIHSSASTSGSGSGTGVLGGESAIWASNTTPNPNPKKPRYVVALYDFQSQTDGDLSFKANDKIEVLEWSSSNNDWWKGKINGKDGYFPANYVQEA